LIEDAGVRARTAGASRDYWHTQKSNTMARALYDKVAMLTNFVQYRRYL